VTSTREPKTMRKHHPANERIKRQYLTFLREAKRHSESTVDAVAKALNRFEEYTKYRDFKVGSYVFEDKRLFFKELGYQEFVTFSTVDEHINYLKRMGFEESSKDGRRCFAKSI